MTGYNQAHTKNVMKQSEFIEKALAGSPIVLVEYRSFKEDTIRYRVKAGPQMGQSVERLVIKHSVEMGALQVQVTEWLPEGTKPGAAQPPFKKGNMAVLELQAMSANNGQYSASGSLYPFEAEPASKRA